jgi:hypothetical protein
MGQAVTLYQTGIVNPLPDSPGQKLFDADRVDASNYAHNKFNSPGGLIMCRVSSSGMEREQGILWILPALRHFALAPPLYSQSRRFLPLLAPCWDAVTRTPKHTATHANRYNGEKYGRFSTAVLGVQQVLSPIENDCTYFTQLFLLNIPSIISDRTSHVWG